MNVAQKTVLLLWLAVGVGLLYVHNPTGNYAGSEAPSSSTLTPEWRADRTDCANSSMQEWRKLEERRSDVFINPPDTSVNRDRFNASMLLLLQQYNTLTAKCINWREHTSYGDPAPFTEWRSEGAFASSLAPVSGLLWAQACIAFVALIALLVLKAPKPAEPKSAAVNGDALYLPKEGP